MATKAVKADIAAHSVVLVSKSAELMDALRGVSDCRVESVESLPSYVPLKAVLVDAAFARAADVSWLRRAYPTAFIAVYSPVAAYRPKMRLDCFEAGSNMVAHDVESITRTLSEAVLPCSGHGNLTCPYCHLDRLTPREIYFHVPAYHINWPSNVPAPETCPICHKHLPHHLPMQVHIHEHHRPAGVRSPTHTGTTQLFHFALVIVRLPGTRRYLLVQEFANAGYWCPGGAVDVGETLQQAARRECLEESGVDIELKGLLRLEVHNTGDYQRSRIVSDAARQERPNEPVQLVRMRAVFYAEPVAIATAASAPHPSTQTLPPGAVVSEEQAIAIGQRYGTPKSCPDFESAGAVWCDYDDLRNSAIKLRGNEPQRWSRYLEEGGAIYPLDLLNEKLS